MALSGGGAGQVLAPVLGWSFGRHKDVRLTLRALNRAVANRRPRAGLVFHTERGIEYAAHAFTTRLAELKITQSMNRPGKVTDNAYIESFFHSLKTDLVHGSSFTDDRQVQSVVRSYIPFYNSTRLHSSLNYVVASDVCKTAGLKTWYQPNQGKISASGLRPAAAPHVKR